MGDLPHFINFYYRLLRFRLLVVLVLIIGAALFETLGVSLFLPMLEGGELDNPVSRAVSPFVDLVPVGSYFTKVLLLMVAVFFLRSGFMLAQRAYIAALANNLLARMRYRFVARLFDADYRYFMTRDAGYFTNAVNVEFSNAVFAFEQLGTVVIGILFAIAYFAIPIVLAPPLAAAIAAVAVPAYFVIRFVNAKTKEYSIATSQERANLQTWVMQALQHFKYLKATASHTPVLERIRRIAEELARLRFRSTVLQETTSQGFAPFTILLIAVVLYYRVQIQGAEIIEVVFVLFLLKRAMDQALAVQGNYRKVLMFAGSIRVFERVDRETRQHREKLAGGIKPDFKLPLVLENVSFGYRDGDNVLRDLSLTIPARSLVAFVGASGAGKSTLVTLLTGLLKPTEGVIKLGDTDYEAIDQRALRAGIGYVTQEGVIFNDTVGNNIALWSNEGDEERVRAAAEDAQASAFLSRLPEGYDTMLGDNGVKLSGGQRQRVSIARELHKSVGLLILDEATSSLDTTVEKRIQRSIEKLRGSRTIVVIAHRLSSVVNSDLIFVLKDGRVVESGTFRDMYEAGGEFKRMVDVQMRAEPETGLAPTVPVL